MKKQNGRRHRGLAAAALFLCSLHAGVLYPQNKMEWWGDADFGMFIHWGLYSILGRGEWSMSDDRIPGPEYEALALQFNPVEFDALEWVRTAKQTGMKYLIFTAKHCDGFCMWDSDLTDYDIVDRTPFGRDVVRELADACTAEGIAFGVYYSIGDWYHPFMKFNSDKLRYINEFLFPQVAELIRNYPVQVLFFDGDFMMTEWTPAHGKALYDSCVSLNPQLIVNNWVYRPDFNSGDYLEYEELFATQPISRPWESCYPTNSHWGYYETDQNWKTPAYCIRLLLRINSKGGNLLLNVGPTKEGLFPQPCLDLLSGIGGWMGRHGNTVYGSDISPIQNPGFGEATYNDSLYYLHVWNVDATRTIHVPLSTDYGISTALYEDGSPVPCTSDGYMIDVQLGGVTLDPIATVVRLDVLDYVAMDSDSVYACTTGFARVVGSALHVGSGSVLEGWTRHEDYAQWKLKAEEAGRFEVVLEYSAAPGYDGRWITVGSGAEEITCRTVSTGGWNEYRDFHVGALSVGEGWSNLTVRPGGEGGADIQLKAVYLVPSIQAPRITDLSGAAEALVLSWPLVENAENYHVYRDTIPFFTPDPVYGRNRVSFSPADSDPASPGMQWLDADPAARSTAHHVYYQVTALRGNGHLESGASNSYGIFHVRVSPANGTDFNWIALPLETEGLSDAEDLAHLIPGCNSVSRWDAANQGFEQYLPDPGVNNFPVMQGHPYGVNATLDTVFTLMGPPAEPVFDLVTSSFTDFNVIMLPLSETQINTAQKLVSAIPNCNSAAYWNTAGQSYRQYIPALPFTNFQVRGGHPYLVNIVKNGSWPSEGADKTVPPGAALAGGHAAVRESRLPHLVWGEASCTPSGTDARHFRAFLINDAECVLTDTAEGCGIADGRWFLQCAGFRRGWSEGDTVWVTLLDAKGLPVSHVSIGLSSNPFDSVSFYSEEGIPALQGGDDFIQNYPNPFNEKTVIRYFSPVETVSAGITIVNVSGQVVRELPGGNASGPWRQAVWDGLDAGGTVLPSGLYFARVEGSRCAMKKMILLR